MPPGPGLAHFTEHAVFLGSERFPDEGEYNRYLALHGGGSNAYTSASNTVYFFTVGADALDGALDRFAQFFVAPLFSQGTIGREVQAVHSEHSKNLRSDGWQGYQLLKHVSAPGQRFRSFSTGNLETLNVSGLREALLAFHTSHYIAPRMRLVITGPQSVEELRGLAAQHFAAVPSSPLDIEGAVKGLSDGSPLTSLPPRFAGAAPSQLRHMLAAVAETADAAVTHAKEKLSPEALFPRGTYRGVLIEHRPVQEAHEVEYLWPLPPITGSDEVRSGGYSYISGLLGDEGPGSVLSSLKAGGLATSLRASVDLDTPGFALLSVAVTLDPRVLARANAPDSPGPLRVMLEATEAVLSAVMAYRAVMIDQLNKTVVEGAAVLQRASAVPREVLSGEAPLRSPEASLLASWPASGTPAYTAWAQQAAVAGLAFKFPDKPRDASSYVHTLARAMHRLGPADVLGPPPARRSWQPAQALRTLLREVTPADVIIMLTSSVVDLPPPRGDAPGRALRDVWGPWGADSDAHEDGESEGRGLVDAGASTAVQASAPRPPHGVFEEPVYGTRYRYTPLPPSVLKRLAKSPTETLARVAPSAPLAFALPPVNPFLPPADTQPHRSVEAAVRAVLAALPASTAVLRVASASSSATPLAQPVLLPIAAETLRSLGYPDSPDSPSTGDSSEQAARSAAVHAVSVWWLPEARFRRPKTHVALRLLTPAAADTPTNAVLTHLWVSAITDSLQELGYQAASGGLGYSAEALTGNPGLLLRLQGYSDAMPAAVERLLPLAVAPSVRPEHAVSALTELLQALRNGRKEQPYVRALYWVDLLLSARRYSDLQLMAAAGALAGLLPADTAHTDARVQRLFTSDESPVVPATPAGLAASITSLGAALWGPRSRKLDVVIFGNEDAAGASALGSHILRVAVQASKAVVAGNQAPFSDADWARLGFAQRIFDMRSYMLEAPPGSSTTSPAAGGGGGDLPSLGGPGGDGARLLNTSLLPRGTGLLQVQADSQEETNGALVIQYQLGWRDGDEGCVASDAPAASGGDASVSGSALSLDDAWAQLQADCRLRSSAASMLVQLLRDPLFDELRTKQQLGYIVTAVLRRQAAYPHGLAVPPAAPVAFASAPAGHNATLTLTVVAGARPLLPRGYVLLSLAVIAQGIAQPPHEMDTRASEFLTGWQADLRRISPVQWASAVDGLRRASRPVPVSQGEAFDWVVGELLTGDSSDFSRRSSDAAALSRLRLEHVRALFRRLVIVSPSRVAVHVYGKGQAAAQPSATSGGAAASAPDRTIPLPDGALRPGPGLME